MDWHNRCLFPNRDDGSRTDDEIRRAIVHGAGVLVFADEATGPARGLDKFRAQKISVRASGDLVGMKLK